LPNKKEKKKKTWYSLSPVYEKGQSRGGALTARKFQEISEFITEGVATMMVTTVAFYALRNSC
jgi:hypothetical protein